MNEGNLRTMWPLCLVVDKMLEIVGHERDEKERPSLSAYASISRCSHFVDVGTVSVAWFFLFSWIILFEII